MTQIARMNGTVQLVLCKINDFIWKIAATKQATFALIVCWSGISTSSNKYMYFFHEWNEIKLTSGLISKFRWEYLCGSFQAKWKKKTTFISNMNNLQTNQCYESRHSFDVCMRLHLHNVEKISNLLLPRTSSACNFLFLFLFHPLHIICFCRLLGMSLSLDRREKKMIIYSWSMSWILFTWNSIYRWFCYLRNWPGDKEIPLKSALQITSIFSAQFHLIRFWSSNNLILICSGKRKQRSVTTVANRCFSHSGCYNKQFINEAIMC